MDWVSAHPLKAEEHSSPEIWLDNFEEGFSDCPFLPKGLCVS